jgi:hypothetical protein
MAACYDETDHSSQDVSRPNQAPKPTQIYSFNQVFGPSTPQNTFFETTTLPLVEQALQGESGLMFSYGVSNSGKTHTIQGGGDDKTGGADRGMIPRSIDVIFNSIEGLECKHQVSILHSYLQCYTDYAGTHSTDQTGSSVRGGDRTKCRRRDYSRGLLS